MVIIRFQSGLGPQDLIEKSSFEFRPRVYRISEIAFRGGNENCWLARFMTGPLKWFSYILDDLVWSNAYSLRKCFPRIKKWMNVRTILQVSGSFLINTRGLLILMDFSLSWYESWFNLPCPLVMAKACKQDFDWAMVDWQNARHTKK